MALPDASIVYDSVGSPKVTLSRTAGVFDLVLEVEGLAPYRTTTAEERLVGITSLNPPTVRAATTERVIASGSRALQAAVVGTPDDTTGPGELAMIHYRATRAIRAALRLLKEDI